MSPLRFSPFVALVALVALVAPASAQLVSSADCQSTPTAHVEWPQDDPLWSFDFVRPPQSSGSDGSGLELRDVYYDGRLVLKRAHVPVLNVEYDPGDGCQCYRDWSDQEIGFRVTPEGEPDPTGCVYVAGAGDVYTTCDRNIEGGTGGDTGAFEGVAVEDFGEELVLTTHLQAGWYRYRVKWHFYTDGRIWPEYSFSAAIATCTDASHRHHAYWRFDFDLDGAGGDVVREVNEEAGTETRFTAEVARTWGDPADGIHWVVADEAAGMEYAVVPSSADLLLPFDAFSKADAVALRYHTTEVDDGSPGCAISLPGLGLNSESLAGEDVVLWYRSSALHTAGQPWECDIVGPMLLPSFAVAGEPGPGAMPEGYLLERAYPNPFNPATTVRFAVAEAQRVTLALYDALGRRVATLYEGHAEANRPQSVRVDGADLPSGTYTVRLEGERVRGATRVVLVK